MGRYRVLIKPSAVREIEAIGQMVDRRRVVDRIQALSGNPRPHSCQKLAGLDLFRIRQGDFRIVYSIGDRDLVVLVVKVGHRREVYR